MKFYIRNKYEEKNNNTKHGKTEAYYFDIIDKDSISGTFDPDAELPAGVSWFRIEVQKTFYNGLHKGDILELLEYVDAK